MIAKNPLEHAEWMERQERLGQVRDQKRGHTCGAISHRGTSEPPHIASQDQILWPASSSISDTEAGLSTQPQTGQTTISIQTALPPPLSPRALSPPPGNSSPRPAIPPPIKMFTEMFPARPIPKIEPKLAGQHNYAEWVSLLEMTLTMYGIGSQTIWDIVTGACTSPAGIAATSSGSSPGETVATTTVTEKEWTKANYFAVLTMRKSCEPGVLSKIGATKAAVQAFKNLKANYERKAVTDLGILLARITRLVYDDGEANIESHIAEFEKRWDFMRSTLSTGTFAKKNFGKALKMISEDDDAKAEFLLLTLPPFYNTLVENLRKNSTYMYGDIVRGLIKYVPERQQGRRVGIGEGTKGNPMTDGKRCDYCIGKGWRGRTHMGDECFTKKREQKRKTLGKTEAD